MLTNCFGKSWHIRFRARRPRRGRCWAVHGATSKSRVFIVILACLRIEGSQAQVHHQIYSPMLHEEVPSSEASPAVTNLPRIKILMWTKVKGLAWHPLTTRLVKEIRQLLIVPCPERKWSYGRTVGTWEQKQAMTKLKGSSFLAARLAQCGACEFHGSPEEKLKEIQEIWLPHLFHDHDVRFSNNEKDKWVNWLAAIE